MTSFHESRTILPITHALGMGCCYPIICERMERGPV